jgi:hypothetical protein
MSCDIAETGLTADGPAVPMGLVSPRKVYADQADIDTPLVRELRRWTWTTRRGSADAGACCHRP